MYLESKWKIGRGSLRAAKVPSEQLRYLANSLRLFRYRLTIPLAAAICLRSKILRAFTLDVLVEAATGLRQWMPSWGQLRIDDVLPNAAKIPLRILKTSLKTRSKRETEIIIIVNGWTLIGSTSYHLSMVTRRSVAGIDLGADVNAALNILAAGLAVSARGGSGITPVREPRTQPRDRPLHAGSTGIPVKMTFVI